MSQRFFSKLGERKRLIGMLAACSLLAGALGAGATFLIGRQDGARPGESSPKQPRSQADQEELEPRSVVVLPKAKWDVAGIRISEARRGEVKWNTWVTGRVALNEDRLAQINPLVGGVVQDVAVQFGDDVEAGEILAVIDSREVGQAKLELFRNRLSAHLAEVDYQWARRIEENAQALIAALEKGAPVAEITESFRDRAIGDYRQQLISAYAQVRKSRADYERLQELSEKGITAAKDLLAAKATLEANEAAFQAWLEQIRFTSTQKALAAKQELERARSAESVSAAALKIMGVPDEAITASQSSAETQNISHYPMTAPFDGTIVEKDVVLKEQVGPTDRLFTIADLSSVWIKADIYESRLPVLDRLRGQTIRFRSNAYPDRVFEARVFYTGDIVSEQSRTVPMTAMAENPGRVLKPGMFLEVELPGEGVEHALLVPAAALQEHQGRKFVFVHEQGDRFARRDVAAGRSFDGMAEITAGLREGEPVVIAGSFFLKSQMLEAQFGDED